VNFLEMWCNAFSAPASNVFHGCGAPRICEGKLAPVPAFAHHSKAPTKIFFLGSTTKKIGAFAKILSETAVLIRRN